MSACTVIFCHGRESGPWGVKIRALARIAEDFGCRVISRDDREIADPELRVERLIATGRQVDGPLVLVGSSMGGYVAAMASAALTPSGLFLMAPAFGLSGYAVASPDVPPIPIAIVHGWDDDVVPDGAVIAFAREHRAMLHLVPAAHALHEQLEQVCILFRSFLERLLSINLQDDRRARLLSTF